MQTEHDKGAAVLAVDDNAANLLAIEAAIGEVGEVVQALSGAEALRLLLERDFALILLDVQMPSLDGYETARLIRARQRSRYTPIVFMTAHDGTHADVLGAYALGAVDFLFKPIQVEVLRAKVHVFVELKKRSLEVQKQAALIQQHEHRERERSSQAEREQWEAEELRRQAQQLARADRHKDHFLAVLGHELRNPLSSVVTGLEVLNEKMAAEDAQVDATARKTRDIIERQTKHLAHLVDDLLDISRISSGKITLQRESVPLSYVIEQAVHACQPAIRQRSQELTVHLPDEAVTLSCDPNRVAQIAVNLLSNASRYTQPGGRIALACARKSVGVEIRVSDNGRGIGAEFMPHVFEAFSQEAEHGGKGLGVGLSVVRQLVALHDGTVSAHSDGPGHGSTFAVCLPLVQSGPARTPVPARETAPPLFQARTASPLSIVLIEDNEDVRELMADMLRGWGHHVETAGDGESGCELALRSRPDLVFIDIGLPKLDGYGVARLLRSHQELTARLIAMTGFGQEEDKRHALDAGFDIHLVKPATIASLHAVLESSRSERP